MCVVVRQQVVDSKMLLNSSLTLPRSTSISTAGAMNRSMDEASTKHPQTKPFCVRAAAGFVAIDGGMSSAMMHLATKFFGRNCELFTWLHRLMFQLPAYLFCIVSLFTIAEVRGSRSHGLCLGENTCPRLLKAKRSWPSLGPHLGYIWVLCKSFRHRSL